MQIKTMYLPKINSWLFDVDVKNVILQTKTKNYPVVSQVSPKYVSAISSQDRVN